MDESRVGEDACEDGGKDTACAVGGEDVESIIYAGFFSPVYGYVAHEGGEDGYDEALGCCDDISARCDGHESDDGTDGCSHA